MLRLLFVALIAAAQWTEFRGPQGTGIVRDAKIPEKWSETENVRWKVPVHGRAWSSPVSTSSNSTHCPPLSKSPENKLLAVATDCASPVLRRFSSAVG